MAWRTLKCCQDYALNKEKFDLFRRINPEKKKHIFSCPYLWPYIKIVMWCLTHHLSYISGILIDIKGIIRRQ